MRIGGCRPFDFAAESAYPKTSQSGQIGGPMKKRRAAKRKSRRAEAGVAPSTRWQLQTAKARFSELFRRARTEGPQWITKQDKEAVVMLPAEQFELLTARAKQPKTLMQF